MTEAMYGINDELKEKALSKIPEFMPIINQFYSKLSNTEKLI